MGFGFNLFFVFVFLPGSLLLLLLAVTSRKRIFLKMLAAGWAGVTGLILLSILTRPLFATIELEKEDYYGSYVIDRSKFPGKQADWQYNSFRFTITSDDRIAFHVTEGSTQIKTYVGDVYTVRPTGSHRLVVQMPLPSHHILASNPTVYRQRGGFYLVFESPRFGNVFFKQGEWAPLDE